ncbi:endonuclease YncB(thermonuclease family) [Bacillus oleivorans]|uniref:Endonuclease YncB( thermonuclease family) n=1 Tax=Bacillus oleivorans TaxID=1448271 RepID=A0A285CJV7_9BACI|nr:DUF6359 domain-containing protein [Bacillus oleivorans]SNX67318.1 endonuclease YncB(thermonuclease family) [Bacillus oleivorans]
MKQLRSASLRLILSFVLVVSLISPFVSKAETADAISVAEAIANNTGTATVEGYIVGHTTGTNSYDREAPFANDYNLAIADSPTETDPAKILPVQLTSEFRLQFGLQTNPDIIGSKIQVKGSLEPYFTVPGLRQPTSITFVEGEPNPEEPGDPQALTIADAKTKTGQMVTIEGVVTADNDAIGGGRLSTYMQDETGGINIFAFDPSTYPSLDEGDLVEVTGTITIYNGLTEIEPEANGIQVVAENQPLPSPQTITLADFMNEATAEPFEGTLVQVEGYVQSVLSSHAGGGYNVTIVDEEFNGTTLRVMEGTNAISSIEQGKWYSFTGIMSQYNSYQLLPRSSEDIQLLENQPPAPDPSGEYEAVVSRVVDGDTINITTPVLGTTSVRFVNIDTPETYHNPQNELDQSQLEHGLAAKEYMSTLLEPGDEVIVKVGEEPLDDYGRLLAQVIRKEDNLNTNLEMVQKGYAVTYFIWPVGDMDEYEIYQAAVREASQAGLGIWNPEDPLLELPFEFRAREQGGGLDKPVGHSDTKEYVAPELWETVPVDKRIFFWSEAEAQAAGFTPADGETNPEEPSIFTIADARKLADGETVTVEGVITTVPGSWGSKGFYVQDETGGIYVYQSGTGISQGDLVRIEGTLGQFNEEKQLTNPTIKVLSSNQPLPEAVIVSPAEVNQDVQGELVKLDGVTITEIKEQSYGTVEFLAVKGEESVLVRIDNRTGYDYAAFTSQFKEGDVINVTGIASIFRGTFQVKPRGEADLELSYVDDSIGSFTFTTAPGDGRKTKVILTGQELKDFRAGKLTIQFDEKALNFLGAESLTDDLTDPVVSEAKGKVELAFAKLGETGLEGNQDLYALTFVQKGKADQAWNIQVKDIFLADSEGNEEEQAGFIYYFSGETSSLSGDVNGDGQVSLADLALLSALIGTESEAEIEKADLNQDGQVDEKDYKILVKFI